ncbi:BRISC complex subunit Abro1 [Pelomyxa schiedti]|nr:BRISC complex subunit Abro1 [Pelomyxa schiedti]
MSIVVRLSGVTFASALYELSVAEGGDMEGAVLGSVTRSVVSTTEDSMSDKTTTVISLNISAFVSSSPAFSFYDSSGTANTSHLLQLAPENQTILGWWKYRKCTSLHPSLRETAVHKSLHEIFESTADSQPLLFVLFTSSGSPIYNVDYKFLVTPSPTSRLRPVIPEITNLIVCSQVDYKSMDATSLTGDYPTQDLQIPPPDVVNLEKLHALKLRKARELAEKIQTTNATIRNLTHS